LLDNPDEARATKTSARPHQVWSLNGVRLSLHPDGSLDRQTLEADLRPRLEICEELRADYLLAVPPRIPGLSPGAAMKGIREGLELVRDDAIVFGSGRQVAFEFLGFHDCPVNTPALAGEVVDQVDEIDLVLDSCHWHASGGGSLEAFPCKQIAMVHLNDAPAKPPREIEDADRVLPGEGVIRLADLVRELQRRGYRGPYSLETFNPAYWKEPPDDVARRGKTALDRLFAEY
jgi:2-keto-myo-inositol isomerase